MAEILDLEKHRQTIREKLNALSEQLENNAADDRALKEFIRLMVSLVENLEKQVTIHQANSLLFEKLILAAPRLSTDYEDFKDKCRQLEEETGFYPKK